MNHISDEAAEKANQDKKSLEAVAEYFGRRHIYAPIAETLSVFYRLKMAEIRLERILMFSNLSKTSKGKITSRDPNQADVKDRKPHFEQTQNFCLTNTCSWSPASRQKRAAESGARANVNGQVKIKVEATVIKKIARDDPLLQEIIRGIAASPHGLKALISVAPTVLNFLKAKLQLLVKHIIAQTYSKWDLELRFEDQDWTVMLVGYLYCHELDELNRKFASGEISSKDLTREVRRHPSVLPTTARSVEGIKACHGVSNKSAEVKCSD